MIAAFKGKTFNMQIVIIRYSLFVIRYSLFVIFLVVHNQKNILIILLHQIFFTGIFF